MPARITSSLLHIDTVSVICSPIGLVAFGEVGDVTDSELDLSDVTDAIMDEFCEDMYCRRSLESLSDTLQPIKTY